MKFGKLIGICGIIALGDQPVTRSQLLLAKFPGNILNKTNKLYIFCNFIPVLIAITIIASTGINKLVEFSMKSMV